MYASFTLGINILDRHEQNDENSLWLSMGRTRQLPGPVIWHLWKKVFRPEVWLYADLRNLFVGHPYEPEIPIDSNSVKWTFQNW